MHFLYPITLLSSYQSATTQMSATNCGVDHYAICSRLQ